MKRKRIYLNRQKTKYFIVELHKKNKTMQAAYDKHKSNTTGSKVLGAHCGYEKYNSDFRKLSPETGIVFLSLEHCGAGIVAHEIGHAVLWGWKHKKGKKQFPIKISNMKEEEEILHNLTRAVRQFYSWYWKIKNEIK